jgi:fumarate hydratase subunit beta
MDPYVIPLMKLGLKGMIGKGNRAPEVVEACNDYNAIYFAATGGAAALIARTIKAAEVIAFDELGPEAIRRLEVEEFPAIVVIDTEGNDFTKQGR